MTNETRLAKLYEVKGLPFPVNFEPLYWANRAIELGVELGKEITYEEIKAMCSKGSKNVDR